jgi:hypothetical protein
MSINAALIQGASAVLAQSARRFIQVAPHADEYYKESAHTGYVSLKVCGADTSHESCDARYSSADTE